MTPEGTVFVVDDDEALRRSLSRLMQSAGLPVEAFADAAAFLQHYDPHRPGCLVLDVRLRGMSGLELQEELRRRGIDIPIIVFSGHANVAAAVRALKSGAVDFIKKPCKGEVLLERVQQALALDAQHRQAEAQRADTAARINALTPREREVLDLLVVGHSAKQIAALLGLSRKTVDIHRSHVMLKLRADSLVDLVRLTGTLARGAPGTNPAGATRDPRGRPPSGPGT